jgi:hypothetical protein
LDKMEEILFQVSGIFGVGKLNKEDNNFLRNFSVILRIFLIWELKE